MYSSKSYFTGFKRKNPIKLNLIRINKTLDSLCSSYSYSLLLVISLHLWWQQVTASLMMIRDYHDCLSYLYRENKNLTGTARYASCNTHLGIGKTRDFSFVLNCDFYDSYHITPPTLSGDHFCRAKPQGWSGIPWICASLFFERKVCECLFCSP